MRQARRRRFQMRQARKRRFQMRQARKRQAVPAGQREQEGQRRQHRAQGERTRVECRRRERTTHHGGRRYVRVEGRWRQGSSRWLVERQGMRTWAGRRAGAETAATTAIRRVWLRAPPATCPQRPCPQATHRGTERICGARQTQFPRRRGRRRPSKGSLRGRHRGQSGREAPRRRLRFR